MDAFKNLSLPTPCGSLSTRRDDSKIRRALSDRLTPSEAIEAAGRMIAGYAHAPPKTYLGYMAALLTTYPRQVALACVEPHGVVSDMKSSYMPTPVDVIRWCENRTRPMAEEAERERRVEAQLRARDAWRGVDRSPDEIERRMTLAQDWLERTSPQAHDLGLKPKALTENDRETLIASARQAGALLCSGMTLSFETLALMSERDNTRALDGEA